MILGESGRLKVRQIKSWPIEQTPYSAQSNIGYSREELYTDLLDQSRKAESSMLSIKKIINDGLLQQ